MINRLVHLTRGLLSRLSRRYARARKRHVWEKRWSRDDFSPAWGGRAISREVEEAVNEGWLPAEGPVLDIGCGLGDISAWFAQRGYRTLGFDIAPSAVERARKRWAHMETPPEFHLLDACIMSPPDWQYKILIDRGCFHQIPKNDRGKFLANILRVSAPDARMMLYIRAFRHGIPFGDPERRHMKEGMVRDTFCPSFEIERIENVYIDKQRGAVLEKALPGMAFWLIRKP